MFSNVVTKHDLYAAAQHALQEGDASSAESFLLKAYNLAAATHNNEPSEDRAEAAVRLARLYRSCGYTDQAMAYYDEAFPMYARVLGETHATTLGVQQEYGCFLTIQHMAAQRAARRMN